MNMNFSAETALGFKDLMFDYLTNVEKRTGFSYDKTTTFQEKEALMNKAILGDISKLAGTPLENSNVNPVMMANHPSIRFASFAVIGDLIDTIVPVVLEQNIGVYTETRFGAFGDDFRFDIESNDLFTVSVAGRAQHSVEFQQAYSGTQYLHPVNHMVSVQTNLYRALCGLDSIAKFTMKAILSIEAAVQKDAYDAMDAAMNALPSTANANFKITAAGGVVSKQDALELVDRVQAFNGGSPAIFAGTRVALSHLFPSSDSGFRYDNASIDYFRNVWGVDTMELRQIANYKSKYNLSLTNDRIYVISPSSDKLIKLCYEGGTITNPTSGLSTGNKSETVSLEKSWAVGVATGSVAGCISLA